MAAGIEVAPARNPVPSRERGIGLEASDASWTLAVRLVAMRTVLIMVRTPITVAAMSIAIVTWATVTTSRNGKS
jgi:hypothetical protein